MPSSIEPQHYGEADRCIEDPVVDRLLPSQFALESERANPPSTETISSNSTIDPSRVELVKNNISETREGLMEKLQRAYPGSPTPSQNGTVNNLLSSKKQRSSFDSFINSHDISIYHNPRRRPAERPVTYKSMGRSPPCCNEPSSAVLSSTNAHTGPARNNQPAQRCHGEDEVWCEMVCSESTSSIIPSTTPHRLHRIRSRSARLYRAIETWMRKKADGVGRRRL